MGPEGTNVATGGAYSRTTTGSHGNWALQGVLVRGTSLGLRDVLDGTANTFLVGEISWFKNDSGVINTGYRKWIRGCDGDPSAGTKNIEYGINIQPYTGTSPYNMFNDISFGSEHPGGCQFVLCDGAVRFVSEDVDMGAYKATASRDGGETERAD
jgi:hypothetical protein